jgi:ABC-type bacteriocin/lantibiotic exporter with double-glycine peptidase domain
MSRSPEEDSLKLFPSAHELPDRVKNFLNDGEEVVAVAVTDLVGGDYGEEYVVLTNDRILVVNEKLAEEVPLSKVTAASIRGYINTCVFSVDTDEGSRSLAVFTRGRLAAFDKLVTIINNLVIGKIPYNLLKEQLLSKVQNDQARESTRTVMVKLLGLLKPISLLLVATIAVAVAIRVVGLVPPYLMKVLVDEVLTKARADYLPYVIGALLAVNLANTALNTANAYLNTKLNVAVTNTLRGRVYRKLHELSLTHYDMFGSGGLWSRIIDDTNRVQWFLTQAFIPLFINAAMIVFVGATLVTMNAWLTLIVLMPIPVSVVGNIIYRKTASRYYHRLWRKWSRIVSVISDTINAAILVKSYGKEPEFERKFEESQSEFERAQMDVFKFEQQIWPAVGLAFTASSLLVWWFGGNEVLKGKMSLGTIMAFTSYMWMFYSPVFGLIDNVRNLQLLVVAASRLFEILDIEPDVRDAPDAIEVELKGAVECLNVWFTYDGIHYALKGVNLKIAPGERVGLVGPSGSGKTTLAKLLIHLYDPQVGELRYDGIDVKKIKLSSLKRQVAVVLQNPVLLDATIADNIALGKEDAKPEEIIAAAKAARVHELVMKLPEAYDTEVGMQGSRLSGGERARVALAAALLKDPKILILDEPTAALDALTEDEVTEELERLTRGRTTIIIAHRLSTLRFTSRIIVMENGRIVEEGTHEELLKRDGLYKRLWEAQLKGLTRMSGMEAESGVSEYVAQLQHA